MMPLVTEFPAAYAALESQWRAQAVAENCVYLPNPAPTGPVDYVFVTQEPSLAVPELEEWIAAGGRNFLWSQEDFILHWAARTCLGGRYHITDISKGAMRVKDANRDRSQRWNRWWPSLAQEIQLLSRPDGRTAVIAVGAGQTGSFLESHGCRPALTILHFSPVAVRWRARAVLGKEEEYAAFAASLTWQQVVAEAARPAFDEAKVPTSIQQQVLGRLPGTLTPSQKQLAFTYKRAFAEKFPRP